LAASYLIGDASWWSVLPWAWISIVGFSFLALYQQQEKRRRLKAGWAYQDLSHPKLCRFAVVGAVVAGIVITAWQVGNFAGLHLDWQR
jgi:hypothetical protein